jgi:SAM-dependent methyltransferase
VALTPPLTAMGTLRWSVVRPILDRLRPARVLEIGCGQGAVGARLARRARYVGVDSDARSCAVARSRVAPLGGRIVTGTVDDLGDQEPFDLLCAFEVMEHIEDDVDALKRWIARLESPGTAILSVPAWPSRFGASDVAVGHVRRYTPDHLDQVMRDAGFRTVQHVLYGWPTGYLLEAVRNVISRRSVDRGPVSAEERTARSGRFLQVGGVAGWTIEAATAPLASLQKLRTDRGIGLVAVGTV